MDQQADGLRLNSLVLRAKAEREEQAALDAALRKLVERQTEHQLTIALRGEKERRARWSQLSAINTNLGAETHAERREGARARLHAMGLDKADTHELVEQQGLRSKQDTDLSNALGAKLSFTRESWEQDATFLRDLFLRSTRPSTLQSHVDENGRPRRREQTGKMRQQPRSSSGVAEEDALVVAGQVARWRADMRLRVSLLRSYVEEVEGACTRFELYAADNTLQPMITRLFACVHVIERFNAEPAQSSVPEPTNQHDNHNQTPDGGAAEALDATQTKGPLRESTSDEAGRSEGASVSAPGRGSRAERVKVEGEIQRCEEIVSRLRTDVTMMLRHMSALQDEKEEEVSGHG